jgi:long-chain acyl-CoA synthetase
MKTTIIDSFFETVERFPEKTALLYKTDHHFESLSYADIYKYAEKLALWMKDQGFSEHDRTVIISENRPEWVISDVATLLLGGILVPVHNVLSAVQIGSIIEETAPKIVIVSGREIFDKVMNIISLLPKDSKILYLDTDLDLSHPKIKDGTISLFKFEIFDKKYSAKIEPVKHDENRIVTIIYTSGTTGRFKGVELTNKNIIANIEGVLSEVEIRETDKFLSILPLSHVFERTVGYYIPMVRGAAISYVIDPNQLSEIAQIEKPTIIIAVPRLFEKVYAKVKEKAEKNPIKKIIFRIAFKIGKDFKKDTVAYKLADKIVFGQIKAAFGGQIRFFVSGAASLAQEIGEFFDALDIPVLEGYGLTETSPIISTNTVEKRKYGTVGRALPNVQTKVVKGELLVKGPNVFEHYYKNPEKTKEAFTKDGWFKTGDLVDVDKAGFIKFKMREKEILVLSTGKNVGPAHLEEKMQLSPFISQAFVFGDNQKHVAALIVPEKSKMQGYTKEKQYQVIQKEIDSALNKDVASYEQIKKFIIISKPFTVENSLLTPTLKLRRKEISEKYAKQISSIYNS